MCPFYIISSLYNYIFYNWVIYHNLVKILIKFLKKFLINIKFMISNYKIKILLKLLNYSYDKTY